MLAPNAYPLAAQRGPVGGRSTRGIAASVRVLLAGCLPPRLEQSPTLQGHHERARVCHVDVQRSHDELGVAHSWGSGPEIVFLSNPLADPVAWSAGARSNLVSMGYRVTTFEHRPPGEDWSSAVNAVHAFVSRRSDPVALVGWSQGAAIAQEVALVAGSQVSCTALLATYGRQNEVDRTMQQCWDLLAGAPDDLDCVRLALGLLTAFPQTLLADDDFVRRMRKAQHQWAGRPDQESRRRSSAFIATYQDRLIPLAELSSPCLVIGFELDTDTYAARAREVAETLSNAQYLEFAGLAHAAPISHPDQIWPPVVDFLLQHHRI